MPSSDLRTIINFGGGWATDFGPSFTGSPGGNAITLPFLTTADNIYYELDGAPHKVGGQTKLNSSQVTESSAAVKFEGIFDYWKQGTAGTETQRRVAVVGTKYMQDQGSGSWTSIATGKELGKTPCFEVFKDHVIIATTSTVDPPGKWDQTTYASLGGTPPQFSFMVRHKNRIWAAGVAAFPSRLYYSALENDEDWTTAGDAGSMTIDSDDGDRIVGLASHKGELFIFKGPNRLSIHRLVGSAPTGDDAFIRVPFITGVGGVNHNTIIRINDDLVFASPRGIHSLAATAAFGNYIEAFLTHPILSYYQDSLNPSVRNTGWGVNHFRRGYAVWTFAPSGDTTKSVYLILDYRFQPARWARWYGTWNGSTWAQYNGANCLAVMQDSSRKHQLYSGGNDGYVRQLDASARTVDASQSYTGTVITPYLNFGSSASKKNCTFGFLSLNPKGNYNMEFGYTRDGGTETTVSVSQAGGFVLDTSQLDIDRLSGGRYITRAFDMKGDFRDIQLRFSQSGSATDMEPHLLELHVTPTGVSTENT